MASSLEISRQFGSFSGVDMNVVVDGQKVGNLQAISYAVQREKAPIYVMGRVDPLAFSRGKRGIAGTIVSIMFSEHLLFDEIFRRNKVILDRDEIISGIAGSELNDATATDDLTALEGVEFDQVTFDERDIGSNFVGHRPFYVDQIPCFDTVIVAVNEQGNASQMRIYGIEVLNEGSGFSVDDVQIENQMTYVCRTILPWQKMGSYQMRGDYEFTPVGT